MKILILLFLLSTSAPAMAGGYDNVPIIHVNGVDDDSDGLEAYFNGHPYISWEPAVTYEGNLICGVFLVTRAIPFSVSHDYMQIGHSAFITVPNRVWPIFYGNMGTSFGNLRVYDNDFDHRINEPWNDPDCFNGKAIEKANAMGSERR